MRLSHVVAGVLLGLNATTGLQSQDGALFQGTDEELVSVQGNLSWDVALGDVDANGTIDAVVAQGGGLLPLANVIWLNDGTGAFVESTESVGLGDSRAIALGDLDGDGDPDVWVGNEGDDEIWINQGGAQSGTPGTFLSHAVIADGSTQEVVLGDLDGDADMDAFVIGNEARVWWNSGTGDFVSGPALPNTWPYCATLADLDQDGDLEVVTGGEGTFIPNQVWWNKWQESEQFTPGPTLVMDGIAAGIRVTHLDNDQFPDIFIATRGSNQIWWNNGDQTFTAGALLGNEKDSAVALADFDGDRDVDALVARGGAGGAPNGYWLNNSDRTFTLSSETMGNFNSYAVAVADFNSDERPDAFVANSGPNKVYLNVARAGGRPGFFADSGQLLDVRMTGVALGDVDGDGDLDAMTSGKGGGGWADSPNDSRLWLNQGGESAMFVEGIARFDLRPSQDVALGDVDGDSDLDAFFADEGPNTVWLNQAGIQGGTAGIFVSSGQELGQYYSEAVALSDFDSDGDLDALVANDYADARLYVNQGGAQAGIQGVFIETVLPIEGSNGYSDDLAVGDLDADGDLDAVVNIGSRMYRLVNQGGLQAGMKGQFSAVQVELIGSPSHSRVIPYLRGFALGDTDGDLDLDLFMGSRFEDTLWINQGGLQGGTAGAFGESGRFFRGATTKRVALGDLSGDGALDAFLACDGDSQIWTNDGTGVFSSHQVLGGNACTGVALGDLDGDGDLDAFVASPRGGRVWLNGETYRLPVMSYSIDLDRDAEGNLVYNWWGRGNAIIPFRLSQPAETEISLQIQGEYDLDVLRITSPFEDIVFPPGSTLQTATIFPDELGGHPGEIWNIYQGADYIDADWVRCTIVLSNLTAGATLTSPTSFFLVFRNPDFGNRQCVLDGILTLTETAGAQARSARLAGSLPRISEPPEALPLSTYRALRDQVMAKSPQGQYFIDLYRLVSPELLQVVSDHQWLLWQTVGVIQTWAPALQALAEGRGAEETITDQMLAEGMEYLDALRSMAPPELAERILAEEQALDLDSWHELSLDEALIRVEQRRIPAAFTRLDITRDAGRLTLRWWGERGITYQVQRSLGGLDSFELTSEWLEGTGAYQMVELPDQEGAEVYFRLEMRE